MEIKEPNWQRINLVVELVILKHEYEIAIEEINKKTSNEFPFNIIKLIKIVDVFNIYVKKLKLLKQKFNSETFTIYGLDKDKLYSKDDIEKLIGDKNV